MKKRKCGLLLAISSLPSIHGIGDMGEAAYTFLDFCVESHVTLWQILPLHPLGYGNSPYQPYSSYAGEPLYISLEKLVDMGLLEAGIEELPLSNVDYEKVRQFKVPYLKQAYDNFKDQFQTYQVAYEQFCKEAFWLFDYALFMALKEHNHELPWTKWDDCEKYYDQAILNASKYEEEIQYYSFLQFIFFQQFSALKAYAKEKGIEVLGDMPIYVGLDSADVWCDTNNFLLAKDGTPDWVAGVPPDYFSEEGQRWGNPIYDWEYLKEHHYSFWIQRLSWAKKLFDEIRIDHFRAFDSYWQIEASCDTAIKGKWMEGPKEALFDEIYRQLPDIQIVAEDLGDLRPSVLELRDHYDLYGMLVLQFMLLDEEQLKDALNKEHAYMYTGTHDNPTLISWLHALPQDKLHKLCESFMMEDDDIDQLADEIMYLAMISKGDVVILPVQDLLHLSDHGRMNTPSTIGSPNWEWRIDHMKQVLAMKDQLLAWIKDGSR